MQSDREERPHPGWAREQMYGLAFEQSLFFLSLDLFLPSLSIRSAPLFQVRTTNENWTEVFSLGRHSPAECSLIKGLLDVTRIALIYAISHPIRNS